MLQPSSLIDKPFSSYLRTEENIPRKNKNIFRIIYSSWTLFWHGGNQDILSAMFFFPVLNICRHGRSRRDKV